MVETVLIVGCGVFGLSTALELAKRGHKVKAIDLYPIPSKWSAANDMNKIIRTEYGDKFYAKLAVEALKQWETDPLYTDIYTKSGRITLSPSSIENQHRAKFEDKGFENLKELGVDISGIQNLKTGEQIGELFPEFKGNELGEINARYNPDAGYGHAADSLVKVYKEATKSGVEFIFGPQGKAQRIINNSSIRVETGDIYTADRILISAGAATGFLIDLQDQIKATGLFVTHIKLTQPEYEKYKSIPIFFSAELGYFFPPDPVDHNLKIAMTFSDARNSIQDPFDTTKVKSLPRYRAQFENDTFPKDGEFHVRKILRTMMPDLQNHELIKGKVCWISDTTDSNFLIDKAPGYDNIYVSCGDSGHGYKFLPNIGKYIVNIMYGLEEDKSLKARWAWKSTNDWSKQLSSRAKRPQMDLNKSDIDWYIEPK